MSGNDLFRYLKPAISIILNASLQQYLKYPRIEILDTCVKRINYLFCENILTTQDIIDAIRYADKPLIYNNFPGYYRSDVPKTALLILRDKLSSDIKKSIPILLNTIKERLS